MKKLISSILFFTMFTSSTTVVATFADNSGTPHLTTISEGIPKDSTEVKCETEQTTKESFWQRNKDTIKKVGIALVITGAGAFIGSTDNDNNIKKDTAPVENQQTSKKSFWQRNKDTIKKLGLALAITGTRALIDNNDTTKKLGLASAITDARALIDNNDKAFTETQQTAKTVWQKSKKAILAAGSVALLTGAGIIVGSIASAGVSAGVIGFSTVLSTVGTTIAIVGSASIAAAFLIDSTVNRYISKHQ